MAARLISETDVIEVTAPPVLLYGQPGSGKTSLGQTCPKPLTLDFDQGAHRSCFRKATLRFDTWEDVLHEQRQGSFSAYQTLVIDTVGTCLEFITTSILNSGSKGVGTKSGGLSQTGWGVLKQTFHTWLSSLRQQGKQIVMIAHQREERDGDSRMLRPDIAGGSYGIVMNCSDIVGYVSYRNGHRSVDWNPTDSYFAKNGAQLVSGAIPDFTQQPTFLGDLLSQAKRTLGHNAQASAEAAAESDKWADLLRPDMGVDQVNGLLPEIKKLKTAALRKQVYNRVKTHAESIGLVWDDQAKQFAPSGEAA